MRPLAEMSDVQIDAELDNYARHVSAGKSLTSEQMARYAALREAAATRGGFDWGTSVACLTEAARERRFVSYGDLASVNGLTWKTARRRIPSHLWEIVRYSNERHGFMFSAIVVDKPNLETGAMSPEALAGFCRAAEALGYRVDDPEAFLSEQQEKAFAHVA